MSDFVYIKYDRAQHLLQEADVLLFRTKGFISACIRMLGEGLYSHVAIASKYNDFFEVIEYKEWFGGRTTNLENYVKLSKENKTEIDVYRVCPKLSHLEFDPLLDDVKYKQVNFDGREVTECMRKLTGLPYSYRRIFLILKIKLFRWHILWDIKKITNEIPTQEVIYPVCSTVLEHCFAIKGFPILKRKSDQFTEPSDFSRSPRLNYLFTLDI